MNEKDDGVGLVVARWDRCGGVLQMSYAVLLAEVAADVDAHAAEGRRGAAIVCWSGPVTTNERHLLIVVCFLAVNAPRVNESVFIRNPVKSGTIFSLHFAALGRSRRR